MATQVGFLFILLDKQFVGAGVQLPVDMEDRLAGILRTVFGEFHGKAMHGTFVDAGDKPFHYLFCHEFYVVELCYLCQVNRICHI